MTTKTMKERIISKIKSIPFYGIYDYTLTKKLFDDNFSSKENAFQYSISKIQIYLGEKNKILGIQTFYKDLKRNEFPGQLIFNKSLKELKIFQFDIPPNDFLCYMNIYKIDSEGIKRLKFATKKGKEFEVGEGGEDAKISGLNDNKKNIILSISGGYSSQLDLINCRYINMNDYFGNILGYFELRIKMKNEEFRNKVESNLNNYEDSDRILIRACLLPESCFNEVIQFCMR